MNPFVAWRVSIEGIVQGVGFRWSAAAQARRLGLRGWIRNEPDGSVLTEFEGQGDSAAAFLSWLERGPSGAIVRSLRKWPIPPNQSYRCFEIE
jgi:acylphosphatase